MEFKKWCPGFKILTYYGSQKERKAKRIGWTKVNAFHVCITSYKLVIQDHQSFRRKKWKYLILDEAQNIKNFKSQRWQLLLNFQTEQYVFSEIELFDDVFFRFTQLGTNSFEIKFGKRKISFRVFLCFVLQTFAINGYTTAEQFDGIVVAYAFSNATCIPITS